VGTRGGKKLKLKLLNSSQQIQKGLWGKRADGTACGDMREEYCVYSIERTFWEGRPLGGIGGEDQKINVTAWMNFLHRGDPLKTGQRWSVQNRSNCSGTRAGYAALGIIHSDRMYVIGTILPEIAVI